MTLPPPGPALADLRAAYRRQGGRLVIHRDSDSGHVETPSMHAAMLDFFTDELAAPAAPARPDAR